MNGRSGFESDTPNNQQPEPRVYLEHPEPIENSAKPEPSRDSASGSTADNDHPRTEWHASDRLRSLLFNSERGMMTAESALAKELANMPLTERIKAIRELAERPDEDATLTVKHGQLREILFHPQERGTVDILLGTDEPVRINGHNPEQLAKLAHKENIRTVAERMQKFDPTITEQALSEFKPLQDALLRSDLPGLKRTFEAIASDPLQLERLRQCLRAFNKFNHLNAVTMHYASMTTEAGTGDRQCLLVGNFNESALVIEKGSQEPFVCKQMRPNQVIVNPELLDLKPADYFSEMSRKHLIDVDDAKRMYWSDKKQESPQKKIDAFLKRLQSD